MSARGLAVVVLAVAVAACSRSPRDASPGDRINNRPAASVPAPVDASAVDAGADPECVLACVNSRQMVAMSIDAIRAECARRCLEDFHLP